MKAPSRKQCQIRHRALFVTVCSGFSSNGMYVLPPESTPCTEVSAQTSYARYGLCVISSKMVQWSAPAPVAATAPSPASDRADRAQHGLRHGQHNTKPYTNPCSSTNNRQSPLQWSHVLGSQYCQRRFCPGAPGNIRATPHGSCGYCRNNIPQQSRMEQAINRMSTLRPSTEKKGRAGFWTRLCAGCQIAEQYLINSRLRPPVNIGMPPIPPPPALQNAMLRYPTNTCTCLPKLTRNYLCISHAEAQWTRIKSRPPRNTAPAADQLVAIRNANAAWLRSIKVNPAGTTNRTRTATAHGSVRASRALRRTCRACRCGNEVVKHAHAKIFQCMACESIIMARNVALPPVPRPWHYWNSMNRGGEV